MMKLKEVIKTLHVMIYIRSFAIPCSIY